MGASMWGVASQDLVPPPVLTSSNPITMPRGQYPAVSLATMPESAKIRWMVTLSTATVNLRMTIANRCGNHPQLFLCRHRCGLRSGVTVHMITGDGPPTVLVTVSLAIGQQATL